MGLFNAIGAMLGGGAPKQDNWYDPLPEGGASPKHGFFNAMGGSAGGEPNNSARQQYGGGGFWDVIGRVSDAISSTQGAPQSYAAGMQQRMGAEQARAQFEREQETRNALGKWLVNPEDQAAFQRALVLDPDKVLGIRKGLEGEDYTMGEGQSRWRGGKEIARGPEKDHATTLQRDYDFIRNTFGDDAAAEYAQYGRGNIQSIPMGEKGTYVGPASDAPGARPWTSRGRQISASPASAPEAAPILGRAAQSKVVSPEDAQRVRTSLGPNGQRAYDAWLQRNGIAVGKNIGGNTYYQIGGRWFDNPEGR